MHERLWRFKYRDKERWGVNLFHGILLLLWHAVTKKYGRIELSTCVSVDDREVDNGII